MVLQAMGSSGTHIRGHGGGAPRGPHSHVSVFVCAYLAHACVHVAYASERARADVHAFGVAIAEAHVGVAPFRTCVCM